MNKKIFESTNKFLKVFLSVIIIFCSLFCVTITTGCSASEEEVYSVVAVGDSISSGYAPVGTDMFDDYQKYVSKKVDICENSFTDLVAKNILQKLKDEANEEIKNVKVKSYAQSGDNTNDLVEKINNKKKYPNFEKDVKNSNLITLSIGANNLLGVITNQLYSFVSGSISIDDLVTYLDAGVQNFKDDYSNTIVPFLTQGDAKVFVMTIYNPFKHFDIGEVEISQQLKQQFPKIENLIDDFPTFMELTEQYLGELNSYILQQDFENVFVVDVFDAFDKLEKDKFNNYINNDSSQLKLQTLSDLLMLQNNVNIDPHPTKEGHAFISQLFLFEIVATYLRGDDENANQNI